MLKKEVLIMDTMIQEYINKLSEERKFVMLRLYQTIEDNLPSGFSACFTYEMPGFCVPLSKYPSGYLNRKDEALPFINIASQKNHVALYHMALTQESKVRENFISSYESLYEQKLDIGKSCIRFKNLSKIPYDLIGELCTKISVDEFISMYEEGRN